MGKGGLHTSNRNASAAWKFLIRLILLTSDGHDEQLRGPLPKDTPDAQYKKPGSEPSTLLYHLSHSKKASFKAQACFHTPTVTLKTHEEHLFHSSTSFSV